MQHKLAFGALSIAISALAYGLYIWRTAKKEGIQPHPFSWILWASVTTVAALVQHAEGAGPGNWVTSFTAVTCFVIGALTIVKHRWRFSRLDWFSLAGGMIVLLFYAFARNPTASAVLATIADVLGYNSTIKKGWIDPYTDSATSFALNSAKFIPALFALNVYSIATWLYPATLVVVNGGVAILLVMRRRHLRRRSSQ